MKKIFLLSSILLVVWVFVKTNQAVLAQTPSASGSSNSASIYNITFPIAALGNCADLASCKIYCDDVSRQDTCIAFAKSKGFYKDPTSVVTAAQKELGCNSAYSCKTFCQNSTNYDKCSAFAKEHNLQGGITTNPGASATLEKAKIYLGCDSIEACKNFCSQEANQQKCTDFAKQNGLKGGTSKVGPGGCTSAATCNTYCADPSHFNDCQQFSKSATGSTTFTGPGGCTSESSCREICTTNPTICQQFGKPSQYPTQPPSASEYQRPLSPLGYPSSYPSPYPSVPPYPTEKYYPTSYPTPYAPSPHPPTPYITFTPTLVSTPTQYNTIIPTITPSVKGASTQSTQKTFFQVLLNFLFGKK